MIAVLASLPMFYPHLNGVYWLGIAAVGCLLVYEHWLVRPDDLARVNTAFFNVNAVVSVGLFVVSAVDLLVMSPLLMLSAAVALHTLWRALHRQALVSAAALLALAFAPGIAGVAGKRGACPSCSAQWCRAPRCPA